MRILSFSKPPPVRLARRQSGLPTAERSWARESRWRIPSGKHGDLPATVAGSMPQSGLLMMLVLVPLQVLSGGVTPRESMAFIG